jgi:hypothetical protein
MRGVAPLEGEGDDVSIGKIRKIEGSRHSGVEEAARNGTEVRGSGKLGVALGAIQLRACRALPRW